MRALSTRRFIRGFPRIRHEALVVTDRGEIVGTWTPAPRKPEQINFAHRAKADFKKKLPFTFAELLKEGKKR